MALAEKKCKSCVSAKRALVPAEYESMLTELSGWTVIDEHHLQKSIKTRNFVQSLELATKIGSIAEEEGHHPDLLVRWGELKVDLWTHKVDGLTEADFILAAKIDQIPNN